MTLLLRRLWIQVTADRRRFTALCVLAALGMLLWARIIVTANLPREAVAGEEGPDLRGDVGAEGADAGSRTGQDDPLRVALADQWRRDPLVPGAAHFPRPTPPAPLVREAPKSGSDEAESIQDEARLTARLQALAERFRLDAVMQGHPMVVINGQSFGLGDPVPAGDDEHTVFRLVEVSGRTAVLECQGRRFRLTMKDPGTQRR